MVDSLELSQFEEHIYNTYLKTQRQQSNKPYKIRKDFKSLEDHKKVLLKKLSNFFNKFKHIDVEKFFKAPFFVYKDETYFDLQYYTSLKAIKSYTLFQSQQATLDPDTDEQLTNIQHSLLFLNEYCYTNKILLKDYIATTNSAQPVFLIHIKEHKINFYTLFGLTDFWKKFNGLDTDLVKFTIGNELYEYIDTMKVKFFSSQKAQLLVNKVLIKIKNNLEKKLISEVESSTIENN